MYDLKYTVAGSFRRKKEDIKDVDIVISGSHKKELYERLKEYYPEGMELEENDLVQLGGTQSGNRILRWYVNYGWDRIKLDCHFADIENYGAVLLYFTGSKEFNIAMRARAKRMGFKLNQYGLYIRDTDQLVARDF